MNRPQRAILTIAAVGFGGVGLWLAGHFDRTGTGGYWAAMGIVAGAGVLLAAAQLRGRDGDPAMGVAFLVTLVVGGWVLLFGQPDPNWFRNHVRAWSADIGIADVVHYLLFSTGVIAFAIGAVFGYTLEPWRRRVTVVETVPAVAETPADTVTADEPVAAERREVATTDGAVVEETTRRERVTTIVP